MVRIVNDRIICCAICWDERKKHRAFKKDKDLNIHLKLKHDSKFKFRIANGSAVVIPRIKQP